MTVDWKKKAQDYKDQYLKDLNKLVSIDSSRDIEHKTKDFPLGAGPAKGLQQFLDLGKRDGFETKNIDNTVGYIDFGKGDKTLGMLAHVDVVPAGEGWHHEPFNLTINGDTLYGRGVADDKGPALAAYYAMRTIKDMGIKPNIKIRFIIGSDEESEWVGMKHYFNTQPAPDFGFSPDADFPLINGEKGIATFITKFDPLSNDNNQATQLENFSAGLRENMVPRDGTAVIKFDKNKLDPNKFKKAFNDFLANNPVTGTIDINPQDNTIKLHVIGKSAHGMEPKLGINAGTYLAKFLVNYDLGTSANNFLHFITKYLHNDSRAKELGLNYDSDKMGDLTMNTGLLNFTKDNGGEINTNFRYPEGITAKQINAGLQKAANPLDGKVDTASDRTPHFVPTNDPLVQTLLNVYKEQTGDKNAQPEVIGGGTFGRLMKRGVAFGALFPTSKDTMHQADEQQSIKDLLAAMAIYGQSLEELSK